MDLLKTFQAIEETRFCKKLSFQERLFFVGETEIVECLQNILRNYKKSDNNFYYDLSSNSVKDLVTVLQHSNNYQAIVVASTENETALLRQVSNRTNSLKINIPVIRLFADIFINVLCQRDLLQSTSDELIKPTTSYAILTTPRSGSTYFCDLLSSTEIMGYPSEHLRLATQELARHCNFNYPRLLYNLVQYRITSNGVFGTKLISHFWFELRRTKPNFRKFFQAIDRYILLVRKDKVAQAVSLVLAQKTEVWHIQKDTNDHHADYQSYKSSLENLEINDELLLEVEQKHKFIINQENRLRRILDANQVKPLEIIYEDILDNPELQIDKVLNFLEIPKPSDRQLNINSRIKKMPSNVTQEIIRQYKNA